jgi:hypothetical protein
MGILGNYFGPLPPHFATAQYQPTPGATFPDPFPSASPSAPRASPPALPPGSPPPQVAAAAAPAQPLGAWDRLGQGIGNGLSNHAMTLMALGAGIAQGGVGRGLALAGQAAEAERNRQLQQLNFLHTYSALTNAGVPLDLAQAAVTNPGVLRSGVQKYFGPRSPGNAAPASAPSAANSNPSPTPAPAVNQPVANWQGNAGSTPAAAPTASANLPAMPPNLSNVAAYHPTLNLWRDRDGNIFGPTGDRVA